jgi:hypothetical protein
MERGTVTPSIHQRLRHVEADIDRLKVERKAVGARIAEVSGPAVQRSIDELWEAVAETA